MTTEAPRRDIWAEMAQERHEREEAHIGRVARAAAAGTAPGAFARRALADAHELHRGAVARLAEIAAAEGITNPHHARAVFGATQSGEARGWDEDRALAAVRRGCSLGLFRTEERHHGPGAFRVETIRSGGPCPTCGRPLREQMTPQPHEEEAPTLLDAPAAAEPAPLAVPCWRCWTNPHQDDDDAALLAYVGRCWTAYLDRPSQKESGKYDDGGAHAYMRDELTGWGGRNRGPEDDRPPYAPADDARAYVNGADHWHERAGLARLIARGLVGMVEEPGRDWSHTRRSFGLTPAGADALGLDLAAHPAPVRGQYLRAHVPAAPVPVLEPPARPVTTTPATPATPAEPAADLFADAAAHPAPPADTSADRRAMAEGMTRRLREDRANPPTPAEGSCERCAPDHWKPCPHAFRCPACGVEPWHGCKRPSGHKAPELHGSRIDLARAHWTPEQHRAERAHETTPDAPAGPVLTLF